MKLYNINLTEEEQEELLRLTTTGRHAALKVMRARILLKADEGVIDEQIAEHLSVTVRTVERVRKRCALEGVTAALNSKKRPPSGLSTPSCRAESSPLKKGAGGILSSASHGQKR